MSGDTTGPTPFAWCRQVGDEVCVEFGDGIVAGRFDLDVASCAAYTAEALNAAVAARERAAAADAERRYQDAKAAIVAHAKSLGGTVYFRGEIIDADATLSDCRAMSRGREFVSRGIDTQRMERAAEAKALREAADAERKLMKHWEALAARYHERGQLQYLAVARAEIDHLLASEGRLRSRADEIEGGK